MMGGKVGRFGTLEHWNTGTLEQKPQTRNNKR
jgi:hypothetical protein